MTKSELIDRYEEELNATLQMFQVETIKEIPEKPYQWRAGTILQFIKELRDLNVETVKLCERCGAPMRHCRSFLSPSKENCDSC